MCPKANGHEAERVAFRDRGGDICCNNEKCRRGLTDLINDITTGMARIICSTVFSVFAACYRDLSGHLSRSTLRRVKQMPRYIAWAVWVDNPNHAYTEIYLLENAMCVSHSVQLLVIVATLNNNMLDGRIYAISLNGCRMFEPCAMSWCAHLAHAVTSQF